MTDTNHNDTPETFEDGLNRVAFYRGVQLCTAAITRKRPNVTHDDGTISGASYALACVPSKLVKKLVDAYLDAPPAPAPPPAEPPADPPEASDPPVSDAVTAVSQTLTTDHTTVMVGESFKVVGTLHMSDKTDQPVSSYRLYNYNQSVLTQPIKAWTPVFTAIAVGTTTIHNDNSKTSASLEITVIESDGRDFPPPESLVPTPAPAPGGGSGPAPAPGPSEPPPPPAAVKAWTPAELGWVDQSPSTNRIDVDITLEDDAKTHLSLYAAPLGVTPLLLDDGGNHPHLTVVRNRDAVKIENTWMRADQNYVGALNVQIDNALVFNQPGVRFDLGCATVPIRTGLPQYAPKPVDKSLIPNYGGGATEQLSRTGRDFGINGRGFDTTAGMGQGGGRMDIGVLPGQSLAYAINGLYFEDLQDFEDHALVWPVHYRDEATGQPVDPTVQVVASALSQHRGYKYPLGVNPIVGNSASPNVPNVAHFTHHAVVGYLATGSDLYAEELAFWAGYAIISQNAAYRNYGDCVINLNSATRHVAWGLAENIFAAAILPDSYPMKAAARKCVTNTRKFWWDAHYAPGMPCHNQFGFVLCVAYPGKDGTLGMAPWMEHFLTSVLHLGVRLGFEELRPWAEFSASFAVNALTDGGLCPQLANNYNLYVCDPAKFTSRGAAESSSAQLVGSWAEIDARTRFNSKDPEYTKSCGEMLMTYAATPGTLYGANGSPESFVANMQPAVAAGVDLGLSNAAAAWEKFKAMAPAGRYEAHAQFNIVPVAP